MVLLPLLLLQRLKEILNDRAVTTPQEIHLEVTKTGFLLLALLPDSLFLHGWLSSGLATGQMESAFTQA